jgi:LmbE family N-acetylglucosaminyl deacetylase
MFGDTKAGWIANGFRVQQAFTKRAGYEAARVTLPRRRNIHADHSHYFAIGVRIRRRWHQPDYSNRDHSVAVEGYLKSALIPTGAAKKKR